MNQSLRYSESQRREYLEMTDRIGVKWLEVFQGDTGFYLAAYWDLFTRLWRADRPIRKTDALKFMVGIKSALTAGKYIETAIEKGLIIEKGNPEDARSRLLELSLPMKKRLDAFFDQAVDHLRHSCHIIDSEPPPSMEI